MGMFYRHVVRDTVRVPPNRLKGDIEKVVLEELKGTYEGTVDEDIGAIVAVI
ncbi:MAG TPA: DNA-directed RNA polymerase, partial [Euryarchaeota archaeon]|nr:DNA-directed RNA polymerase [Euryarchaeota archaeon]